MKHKFSVVLGALILAGQSFGFDHTHSAWDKWLKRFVTTAGATSTVDYKAAKAAPEALKPYLQSLEAVTLAEYGTFSDAGKMAFLINTYNARTAELVTEGYPVKSIKDLGSLFTSPWKKKFFKIFGDEQNLDFIEHDQLRKNWQEPRIHFAVNCASKGCPALRGEAFVAIRLEGQLENSTKLFLNDATRNRWSEKEAAFSLSRIFSWYGEDFVKKAGSVQSFVTPRMAANPEATKKMAKGSVSYLEYDWSLNETTSRGTTSKN